MKIAQAWPIIFTIGSIKNPTKSKGSYQGASQTDHIEGEPNESYQDEPKGSYQGQAKGVISRASQTDHIEGDPN